MRQQGSSDKAGGGDRAKVRQGMIRVMVAGVLAAAGWAMSVGALASGLAPVSASADSGSPAGASAASGPANAAPDASTATADPPVPMPGTRVLRWSRPRGEDWQVMVAEPSAPPPENGYRVLYVLDGNSVFGAFRDAVRLQSYEMPDVLLVGVGYAVDTPFSMGGRSYDYSPVAPPGTKHAANLGGEDGFLAFLTGTLQPEIARRYRIDPRAQTLFGHSFGGMFALHAMYAQPQAFSHYVAVSPSLWWQDNYLLPRERAFAERVRAGQVRNKVALTLLIGGQESPQMIQDTRALAARMAPLSAWGIRSSVAVLPDETHMSVPIAVITRVLRDIGTVR